MSEEDIKANKTVIGWALDAGVEITPEVEAVARHVTKERLEAAQEEADKTISDIAESEFKKHIPTIIKALVGVILAALAASGAYFGLT
jgi:hypothetical protein